MCLQYILISKKYPEQISIYSSNPIQLQKKGKQFERAWPTKSGVAFNFSRIQSP